MPHRRRAFAAEVGRARSPPGEAVVDLLAGIAATSQRRPDRSSGLRTALSAFGAAEGLRPLWDLEPVERRRAT